VTIWVRNSGATDAIGAIRVREGGVTVEIAQVYVQSGGVAYPLFGSSISASAAPIYCSGYSASGGSIYITTESATVTVSGGTAPYTYAWVPLDSGWAAIDPSHATTPFRSPLLGTGENASTTFTCTVTDALGRTASANVEVYAENLGYGY
jgi:hypothetical protein